MLQLYGDVECNPGPIIRWMSSHSRKPDISTPNTKLSDLMLHMTTFHLYWIPTVYHRDGGGLAFIHHSSVQPIQLNNLVPSSFEFQVQLRITSCRPCITVVNIHRPLDRSLSTLYDEFRGIISTIPSSHMRRYRRASCWRLLDQSGIGWCARDLWKSMSGHRSETIRTIYLISLSRINLRILEMCGSSTQDWCRITNSSLHQSTSPHRPTSNPD